MTDSKTEISAALIVDATLRLVSAGRLAHEAAEMFGHYLELVQQECRDTPGFAGTLFGYADDGNNEPQQRALAGYFAALCILSDDKSDIEQQFVAIERWRDSVTKLLDYSPSFGHLAFTASSPRWDDVRHGHVEELTLLDREMLLLLPRVLSVYAKEEPFKAIEEAEATLCSYRKLSVNLGLVEVIACNACAVLERPNALYKKEDAITVVYALARALDFVESDTPLFKNLAAMKDAGVRVLSCGGYHADCAPPCRVFSHRPRGGTAAPF